MSDRGQRTEKPTPKRMREARREGRIPRSQELTAWASLLMISVLGRSTVKNGAALVGDLMRKVEIAAGRPDPDAALELLGEGFRGSLGVLAPLLAALVVVGVAGNLAQVGFAPTLHPLKPQFSRIDPVKGAKRLISPASLWELGKNVFKLAVLALVGWRLLSGILPALMSHGNLSVPAVVATAADRTVSLVRTVAIAGLGIAALDYGIQRRRVMKTLRMSKQEVKEEQKQDEGDPRLRGAIRERQLRMSRMRMMADVAKADVVIVNPVHVAVALRYEPLRGAPRVVAKGAGEVARRIREEAERHRVPLVEDIPLARAIHRVCELGEEVPAELYEAVARVLAFVFGLRARGQQGGRHHLPGLPVPV